MLQCFLRVLSDRQAVWSLSYKSVSVQASAMESPPLLTSLPDASPGSLAGQQGLNPQVSTHMARQLMPDCLGGGSRQVHVGRAGSLHAAGCA